MAESPGSIVRDGYLTSTSSPTSSGEDKLSGSDLGDTNGIWYTSVRPKPGFDIGSVLYTVAL